MLWRFKRFSFIPTLCSTSPYRYRFSCHSHSHSHSHSRNPNLNPIHDPSLVRSTLLKCPSDLIALSFFLSSRNPNSSFHDNDNWAYDHMVAVLSRLSNRLKSVDSILKELRTIGISTGPRTFLTLLRIYWRGGMYSFVFETFFLMENYGFLPNTFARNILMDVLFRVGDLDKAVEFLMQTQCPNFLSFNIALSHLCRAGDVVYLRSVFRMMIHHGFFPSIGTFEVVLNRFCKLGRLVEALRLLSLMIKLGNSVSVNIWTILINGFCKRGRFDMADYMLKKMDQTGCSPNVVTYTDLVKGFMDSGLLERASAVISIMETKGVAPDLVLCNVLIDCLCKNKLCGKALRVYDAMSKWKLVPDSYTLSSLLTTIRLSRKFDLFPELQNGLPQIDVDLVACNSFLSYFCKAGFPSRAVELYVDRVSRDLVPDKYTFVAYLSGLCGVRKTAEAVKLYNYILKNYSTVDAHIHTAIVDGLIRGGKSYQAIRLFRKAVAEKYALDVVSYSVVIRELFRGGRGHEISYFYDQMKEGGVSPDGPLYNMMLSGFCKERDDKMVKQLLHEMVDSRIKMSFKSFINIIKYPFRPRDSYFSQCLLVEMRDLELLPPKAMALFCAALPQDECLNGAYHLVSPTANNISADTSSSEDFSDIAASVG